MNSNLGNAMTSRSLKPLTAVALLLAFSGYAVATIVERLTLDLLVNRAEVVFRGVCESADAGWVDPVNKRQIYTEYTFQILDNLKGAPGRTFTFRTLGGTLEGRTYHLCGVPLHQPGEECVLFLTVPHPANDCRMPVGLSQGKFPVAYDARTGTRTTRQDASGIVFLNNGKADPSLPPDDSLLQEQPLDDLLAKIRAIVASPAPAPERK